MNNAIVMRHNPSLDLDLNPTEARRYSVSGAILQAAQPNNKGSFEEEVSEALAAKMQRRPTDNNSIFIPTRLSPRASGLDTKTNAAGKYTVATDVLDLIDLLRAQTRLAALGATFLTGLERNIVFAVEKTASGAAWTGENPGVDVDAVDMTFGAASGSPHQCQSTTSLSRQLLAQASSNIGLEGRIRLDLMRSHAIALDGAAIAGTGVNNQPTGLLGTSGVSVVAIGADGGSPTYNNICSLEEQVGLANADPDGFLTTPSIRRKLRETFTNGTGSKPVWDDGNEMLGLTAATSTNVPSTLSKGNTSGSLHAIVCGKWSELVVAEWGAIEVIVNAITLARRGIVECTAVSWVDVLIPRPAAFSCILDASA